LPFQEKFVGHRLKLLDAAEKIWAPLRNLFATPGVPSRCLRKFKDVNL